jgi:hypothetical protein
MDLEFGMYSTAGLAETSSRIRTSIVVKLYISSRSEEIDEFLNGRIDHMIGLGSGTRYRLSFLHELTILICYSANHIAYTRSVSE